MSAVATAARTELAQRSNGWVDVTLLWEQHDGVDTTLVCVTERETGSYFEIPAEPHQALDVYYHPFAYRTSPPPAQPTTRLAGSRRWSRWKETRS
jgi:hypothetical protein